MNQKLFNNENIEHAFLKSHFFMAASWTIYLYSVSKYISMQIPNQLSYLPSFQISYDNFSLEGKSEVGLTRNSIELRENFIIFGHDYKKTVTLTLDPSIVVLVQWKGKIDLTFNF